MLYDNAQLAHVYLHAYQVTGNEFYKRITTEILDVDCFQVQNGHE